ncbi:MAG: HD domain-containing protein [Peptococcaceae bacterium]|jgi:putative two-component system response regulator|nr:HD domain-containing protein [Peptococcaceae bacterium]
MKQYGLLAGLDFDIITSLSGDAMRLGFDYFADQVDNEIQNHLISELMVRYTDVSRQIEEKNERLRGYSERLEDLVQEKVNEISASQVATIHALVKAAESRDDDTGTHIERTSSFCRLIAEKLYEDEYKPNTIDEVYAENIAKASPLHDIGKVGIMDAILLKPSRLTPDEFEVMKTHVDIGHDTLVSVQTMYPGNVFLKYGIEIAKYHHEKWDGSGYMRGLAGEEIPLSARIMALSDVYDALRSKRIYKDAYSHDKTCTIITEGRGSHFDPVLVDIFLDNHSYFDEIYHRLSS